MNHSFPKQVRLLKPGEFEWVQKNGVVVADDCLVVKATKNNMGYCRMGLAIGRIVGNAVVRNRWKRLIREAFRQNRSLFAELDIVVRPKKGATADLQKIQDSLISLLNRAWRRLQSSKS